MATIAVYWVALTLPILIFIAYKLYRHAINSYRETNRIESITKSPLLSYLAETHSGSSTIRAFGKKREFIEQNNKLLNNNILANQWS